MYLLYYVAAALEIYLASQKPEFGPNLRTWHTSFNKQLKTCVIYRERERKQEECFDNSELNVFIGKFIKQNKIVYCYQTYLELFVTLEYGIST